MRKIILNVGLLFTLILLACFMTSCKKKVNTYTVTFMDGIKPSASSPSLTVSVFNTISDIISPPSEAYQMYKVMTPVNPLKALHPS